MCIAHIVLQFHDLTSCTCKHIKITSCYIMYIDHVYCIFNYSLMFVRNLHVYLILFGLIICIIKGSLTISSCTCCETCKIDGPIKPLTVDMPNFRVWAEFPFSESRISIFHVFECRISVFWVEYSGPFCSTICSFWVQALNFLSVQVPFLSVEFFLSAEFPFSECGIMEGLIRAKCEY